MDPGVWERKLRGWQEVLRRNLAVDDEDGLRVASGVFFYSAPAADQDRGAILANLAQELILVAAHGNRRRGTGSEGMSWPRLRPTISERVQPYSRSASLFQNKTVPSGASTETASECRSRCPKRSGCLDRASRGLPRNGDPGYSCYGVISKTAKRAFRLF